MQQGWLKVKHAAKYADVSERTLRKWLKHKLRFSRLPSGLILIKSEWVDQFLERFIVSENEVDIDLIVADIMKDFRKKG
jgi:excisionase family DNA binding protein